MPQLVQCINIFVASPGDVNPERKALDSVVSELDHLAIDQGMDLQVVDWKRSIVPGFGGDGQAVINQQVQFDNIDIFVGIIWRRLGQPTPRAASGTVEEFNRALQSQRTCGRPWSIMFFVCNRSYEPRNADEAKQQQLANAFKRQLDQSGVTVHYDQVTEFRDQARFYLQKALNQFFSRQIRVPPPPQPQPLQKVGTDQFGNMYFACPWCGWRGTGIPFQIYPSYVGSSGLCARCSMPVYYPP